MRSKPWPIGLRMPIPAPGLVQDSSSTMIARPFPGGFSSASPFLTCEAREPELAKRNLAEIPAVLCAQAS
jgi:hypothetical protein